MLYLRYSVTLHKIIPINVIIYNILFPLENYLPNNIKYLPNLFSEEKIHIKFLTVGRFV